MKYRNNSLRGVAKSQKYQMLYARAKEMTNIKIFQNVEDFSAVQLEFLYWLEIYSQLYQDLAMKENYITQKVIDDDIEIDAYLYWKSQKKEKKEGVNVKDIKPNFTGIPSLIQKKPRHRNKGKRKR